MESVTILVPCYNEERSLTDFYQTLCSIIYHQTFEFTILFIDDGSQDHTLQLIQTFAQKDPHVKYLSFSRNFGKEAAIYAGLTYTNTDYGILMDADLEHPPALIPEFLKLRHDYDQIIAQRINRKQGWCAKVFTWGLNLITNQIHLNHGIVDYRLMNQKVIQAILQMPERERYSRGMFDWVGFSKAYISYQDIKQTRRKSTWSFRSLFAYAMNAVFSFSDLLLNSLLFIGITFGLMTVFFRLFQWISFDTFWILLFASGIQCSIGILALYLKRIFQETKKRPIYFIAETNVERKEKKYGVDTEE